MSYRRLAFGLTLLIGLPLAYLGSRAMAYTPPDAPTAQKIMAQSQNPVRTPKGCRVTVAASATALTCSLSGARVRVIKNCDTSTWDLGASDVATGAGYRLEANESVVLNISFSAASGGTSATTYGVAPGGTTRTACVFEAY